MENTDLDKLTKKLMVDSKLRVTNPIFDDIVMNRISLEAGKQKNRKDLLINILIFSGIESIIFVLLLFLLNYFSGYDYFASTVKNSMQVFQKIGNLAIRYDYLILSFIVVGILDLLMNKKKAVSVKL